MDKKTQRLMGSAKASTRKMRLDAQRMQSAAQELKDEQSKYAVEISKWTDQIKLYKTHS